MMQDDDLDAMHDVLDQASFRLSSTDTAGLADALSKCLAERDLEAYHSTAFVNRHKIIAALRASEAVAACSTCGATSRDDPRGEFCSDGYHAPIEAGAGELVEKVAKAHAFARRSRHDRARDAEHYWQHLGAATREQELQATRTALTATEAIRADAKREAFLEAAQFVREWNGNTAVGDTFLIAEELEEKAAAIRAKAEGGER